MVLVTCNDGEGAVDEDAESSDDHHDVQLTLELGYTRTSPSYK